MKIEKKVAGTMAAAVLALSAMVAPAAAQVGKSLGVVDANTAPEKGLLTMPHMYGRVQHNGDFLGICR